MKIKKEDNRLLNEIIHGELITDKGEHIWNWSSPAGKIRLKRRCQMLNFFIGNDNKLVLEIGCGTGLFTQAIAKSKNKIIAIDISNSLLKKARKRIHSKNVSFRVDNAYKTKFKNNFFDYIVGSSVLHHLDIDFALKEIERLLKPGGKFIFTEPNMLNPQVAIERNIPIIRKLANNSPDETAFIRWSIKAKLEKAGFQNIQVKPFDFLHPATPYFMLAVVQFLSHVLELTPILKEIAGSLVITGAKGKIHNDKS